MRDETTRMNMRIATLVTENCELKATVSKQRKELEQLAEALENMVSGSDIQRQAALHVLDKVHKAWDQEARNQVEQDLYRAGITEDPDMDGGLLG